MARVLVLLPALDFDPSEAAVSWRVLVNAGHTVSFATPDGRPATADDMMLTGQGLDPWGAIPLLQKLPLIGLLMRANRDARKAYAAMIADPDYLAPQRWEAVEASAVDGLLLPGGHRARGMREYLESSVLQNLVIRFFEEARPVAAICHGVLLAARSISKKTGRSVLAGYQTTARFDLGVREQRVVGRAHHAVLGSRLLPDLSGAGRAAQGVHVGAAGSDARARPRRGFPRCAQGRSVLPPQEFGPGARFPR
jgi:putative intracellular protease/amidase